jgi:glycosyltransferase involved in cell wall biosynthesis
MPGAPSGRSTWQGVQIVAVPALRGKHWETLSRTTVALMRALSGRYDVLHFTHQGPGFFVPVARLLGIPSVVSVAGLDWQRAKWGRAARLAIRRAERIAVRDADAIVVLSKTIQEYFDETYGVKTTYIPNGLERRAVPATTGEIRHLGVEPDGYALFAGRLVPEKAVHELIAAWNGVKTNMKLVIAGAARYDAEYADSLRRMAGANVVFTGHVEGQVLAELFGHCRIFVLPSHLEGQSIALLEALGYGRAVLVSSIPENTDVVGRNGLIFPVGDVSALRCTLQEIADNPSLVERSRAAVGDGRVNYASWEEVARRHEEVYRSVARPSSGGRERPGRSFPAAATGDT